MANRFLYIDRSDDLFNTFRENLTYSGSNAKCPYLLAFGVYEAFMSAFRELERCSEDSNGILKSGTVFWNPERYFSFWNVVLALRMLPGNGAGILKAKIPF